MLWVAFVFIYAGHGFMKITEKVGQWFFASVVGPQINIFALAFIASIKPASEWQQKRHKTINRPMTLSIIKFVEWCRLIWTMHAKTRSINRRFEVEELCFLYSNSMPFLYWSLNVLFVCAWLDGSYAIVLDCQQQASKQQRLCTVVLP